MVGKREGEGRGECKMVWFEGSFPFLHIGYLEDATIAVVHLVRWLIR